MKCLHIITGLHTGGAEMSLYRLVVNSPETSIQHEVMSLTGWGPMGDLLVERGIKVTALDLRGRRFATGFGQLVRGIRNRQANVVQAWMYHANLLGGLAARAAGGPPMIWNIRASTLKAGAEKRTTRAIAALSGRVACPLCRAVVTNSESAVAAHVAQGYPRHLFRVIPNGFEVDLFRPDEEARQSVRRELGIGDGTPLIGIVGRYHPAKDHPTFLRAAARLASAVGDVHFVLVGDGLAPDDRAIQALVRRENLVGRVSLLGRRQDVHRVLAALDLLTSCSLYESFPNVLCEAMACGVPCVTTDVGDAALIVGDTGRVVPLQDAGALAEAWSQLLALKPAARRALGARARDRVVRKYAIDAVVERYTRLYESLGGA